MLRFPSVLWTPGSRRLFASVLAALLAILGQPSLAQQFVVDDAAITDPGACQIEAWLGEAAAWILPACSPLASTEITLGLGYADQSHGAHIDRHVEYAAQAKVNVRADAPGAIGASVVAGFGFRPFAQATGMPLEGLFLYLPITYSLPGERAMVHLNCGWSYDVAGSKLHRAIFGARTDLVLSNRLEITGEIFGEGADVGMQGGLRFLGVPDLFLVEVSYGAALTGVTPDIGLALGISLTPPAFFSPIR
jgi:hypothetical protein